MALSSDVDTDIEFDDITTDISRPNSAVVQVAGARI